MAKAQQEIKVRLELTDGYRTRFTEAVCKQLMKKGKRGNDFKKNND